MSVEDQPKQDQPEPRVWLTAEYENGHAHVVGHATVPFGQREATVHLDTETSDELHTAFEAILEGQRAELLERAQDAVSEHRTLMRVRGEDHRAELTYVGPTVEVEDGVFSDESVMKLPAGRREAAIKRTQAVMQPGEQES